MEGPAPDFVPAGKSGLGPEEIRRSKGWIRKNKCTRLTLERLKTGELEQHLEARVREECAQVNSNLCPELLE